MLTKQNLDLSFAQGLDTKTDPKRVQAGKFVRLVNSVFDIAGQLKKRNGFGKLTALPSGTNPGTLTSFSGNLTSISNNVSAYSAPSAQWKNTGYYQPCELGVQPLVRTAYSQTTVDVAVSQSGAACTVFLDGDGSYKYQISDVTTGQVLQGITLLPSTATKPRAFVLGRYFVITFLATVAAAPHLQFIAIPLNNFSNPIAADDLSTQVSGLSAGYDGFVANNTLYIAWDGNDMGGAIRASSLDQTLLQHTTVVLTGKTASLLSITADTTGNTPVIYVTAFATNDAYTAALNQNLSTITAFTKTIDTVDVVSLTSSAQSGVCTIIYETNETYGMGAVRTDFTSKVTMTQAGVVGTPSVILRSVGIASKSFIYDSVIYFLATYKGQYQPSYFLVDTSGHIIARLAYSNGAGYATTQVLPGVWGIGDLFYVGYLLQDLIQPVNRNQTTTPSTPVPGVYAQTGVNVVHFDLTNQPVVTSEIGLNLNLAGGIMWAYDGIKAVEQNFLLWPEDIEVTPATSGGDMTDQTYFYQVTYEWTDGQGIIHRSAPSIPQTAVVSGGSGSGSVTLDIPMLRLTYKTTPNEVRIVVYRWSTAQPIFYQVTSVTAPKLNDPSTDLLTFVDDKADSAIVGNSIIYTNGGVVEDVAPPSTKVTALFKSRLFYIDAEDENILGFSKQVIEGTPVEFSSLFTLFVAPTTGAQGSTGNSKCLAPMDDKLIIFKKDAAYYITGTGPDNTGANNDFSDPIFITATVGCENQQSIVFIPQGIMFQSDKGIWLLGRDLSTNYIGSPVEEFNDDRVVSAQNIPGTNQVRFLLESGTWLMYDYFYGQWGSFQGVPGISSTLYNSEHTYLSSAGTVFQETPGIYLDNSNPVLMSFTTGWLSLAGVQGYQRAYYFNLLGTYFSPHVLNLFIAYDYNSAPTQQLQIRPNNFVTPWGTEQYWGAGVAWGGPGNVEQWKVNLQRQRCQAFQISISEQFDSTYSQPAGEGLTLSGINLVVGVKKGFVPQGASQTVG